MDKKLLVDQDIKEGARLIEALDKLKSFPVQAALWLYFPDTNNWRLIIATSKLEKFGPIHVYTDLLRHMNAEKINISIRDIAVIKPNDNLIVILRRAIKTEPKSILGVRFTANTIDNHFIDDAYIYRLV